MLVKDGKLRNEMLKRGEIYKGGVKISMHEWGTVVNTLSEDWYRRKERWFNVVELPFHLRSEENFLKLGGCLGEPVEVDQHSIDMAKLDYARVKVGVGEVCPVCEPITVSDGFKEYNVMMFPAVSGEDFNMILNFPLSKEEEMACNDKKIAEMSLGEADQEGGEGSNKSEVGPDGENLYWVSPRTWLLRQV